MIIWRLPNLTVVYLHTKSSSNYRAIWVEQNMQRMCRWFYWLWYGITTKSKSELHGARGWPVENFQIIVCTASVVFNIERYKCDAYSLNKTYCNLAVLRVVIVIWVVCWGYQDSSNSDFRIKRRVAFNWNNTYMRSKQKRLFSLSYSRIIFVCEVILYLFIFQSNFLPVQKLSLQ